jgi:multiple sugar transport system permease protein
MLFRGQNARLSTMQPPARRSKSDLERAQTRAGYLFILPSFALYAVFVLAPVIVTFVLSFTYYDPIS